MADLERPVSAAAATACTHRWQIATPVDDCCKGICRLCGAERSFTNARYAFGQPGRHRRTTSAARTQGLAHGVETGALAQFLARNQALAGEAARPA